MCTHVSTSLHNQEQQISVIIICTNYYLHGEQTYYLAWCCLRAGETERSRHHQHRERRKEGQQRHRLAQRKGLIKRSAFGNRTISQLHFSNAKRRWDVAHKVAKCSQRQLVYLEVDWPALARVSIINQPRLGDAARGKRVHPVGGGGGC